MINSYNKKREYNNNYYQRKQREPPQDNEHLINNDDSIKIDEQLLTSDPSKIYYSGLNDDSRMRYLKNEIENLKTSEDLLSKNIEK